MISKFNKLFNYGNSSNLLLLHINLFNYVKFLIIGIYSILLYEQLNSIN
jgi:hypothetical protein